MSIINKYGFQVQREHYPEKSEFKFGYNPEVGTDPETIWDGGGLYSYPTSASIMKVSSSNNLDTSTTLTIYGLNENYDAVSESITLNGQTAVNTTNQYIRSLRVIVNTNEPQGDIYVGTGTVTSGVPANVYAKVHIGENQTLMAIWTVPRNHTAYLYDVNFNTGTTVANKFIEGRLKVKPFGEVFQTKGHITTATNSDINYSIPLILTEKTDVELQAFASSGTNAVSATMSFIYIDNDC